MNDNVVQESAMRTAAQKSLREVTSQLTETMEDLEAEKEARTKAERIRRDLSEELEALKTELVESMDTGQTQMVRL